MVSKDATVGNVKYLVLCLMQLVLVRGYVATFRHIARPLLMSGKTPAVASGDRRQFNFKELIEKCSENNVYTTAVRAAAQYLHSSETLTQAGVNSVIKIYGLAAMVEDAVEALKIAESKGVLLNVRHYNAVINVCRIHKYYDEAVAVYERLLSLSSNHSTDISKGPPIYPDIASKSCMIGILGEQGNWQRALTIFKEIPKDDRDTILYTTILGTLEKNGRSSEAQSVFEELLLGIKEKKNKHENKSDNKNRNIPVDGEHSDVNATRRTPAIPTLRMYTSIISVHGKNGDWERSWGMFQNMQKPIGEFPALIPDKVLIFTMVRILEKAGQLEKAALVKQSSLRYFVERSSSDDSIAAPNFSDLIREGKRSGDFRAAFAAADSWLAIDSSIYTASGVTACINVYGLAMQPLKAISLLDTMTKRGVPVNVVQYNAVMAACVKGNKCDEALELFAAMTDKPTTPPLSPPFSSPALPLSPPLSPPFSLPQPSDTLKQQSVRLVRDAYSYGTALHALSKKGSWVEALALLRTLENRNGVQQTTVMCNTVLSALGKAKQFDTAIQLYNDMKVRGPSPDRITQLTAVTVFEGSLRLKEAAELRSLLGMGPAIIKKIRDVKSDQEKEKKEDIDKKEKTKISGLSATKTEENRKDRGDILIKSEKSSNKIEVSTKISLSTFKKSEDKQKIKKIPKASKNAQQTLSQISATSNSNDEFYPDGLRISPAGTLKDKLLENGRREVKIKTLSRGVNTQLNRDDVLTFSSLSFDSIDLMDGEEDAETDRDENDQNEKISDRTVDFGTSNGDKGNSMKMKNELVVGRSKEGTDENGKKESSTERKGENYGRMKSVNNSIKEKNEMIEEKENIVTRWEKGGGGAASIMLLYGLSGRSAQAEELLISLEQEVRGSVEKIRGGAGKLKSNEIGRGETGSDGEEKEKGKKMRNKNDENESEDDDESGMYIRWSGDGLPSSLYNAAIGACAVEGAWERALSIYNRMIPTNSPDRPGFESNSQNEKIEFGKSQEFESGVGIGIGMGTPRNRGTYKELLPILEKASKSTSAFSDDSSVLADDVVAKGDENNTPSQIPSESERARTALEIVRRTGRIEGLIF